MLSEDETLYLINSGAQLVSGGRVYFIIFTLYSRGFSICLRTAFLLRGEEEAGADSLSLLGQVTNIKKTLKATASSSAQEMEQQLVERECPPHTEQRQPTKKMSKVKGLVSSRH